MTERVFDPDGCWGCNTDGRCMGTINCPACYRTEHYCDICGEEIDKGDLCETCREEIEEAFDENKDIDNRNVS